MRKINWRRKKRADRGEPLIGFYGTAVILTYIGAASGLLGMYLALNGHHLRYALICLMVSGLCDAFDGKVANLKDRTAREKSYGIQIDSLSDLITFGVLPAIIGYTLVDNHASRDFVYLSTSIFILYVLAALIRLAYFNVTEAELISRNERRKYYEGLPVTSVAVIIPVVYSACRVLNAPFPVSYTILLAVLSAAFVLKIKIPKPRGISLVIICLIGLPAIVYIFMYGGA